MLACAGTGHGMVMALLPALVTVVPAPGLASDSQAAAGIMAGRLTIEP